MKKEKGLEGSQEVRNGGTRIAETLATTVIFPPQSTQENSESGNKRLVEKERERIEHVGAGRTGVGSSAWQRQNQLIA